MSKICTFNSIVVLFVFLASESFAGEMPQYIGAKKCETCHSDQFDIWSKGPHAKSYDLLNPSDKAKENAKLLNVAEWAKLGLVNPTEAQCKSCHKYDEHFSFPEKFKKIAHPR